MRGSIRQARLDGSGYQVIEIDVDGGYRPGAIEARAGVPLRLVFHRRDLDPCTERVIFSEPPMERQLARNGSTEIILPIQRPGRIRFTCGMGRYHGAITVRPAAGPRLTRGRLQGAWESPLDTLGLAAALWLCSLPLIALFSLLVAGVEALLPLAGAALVAWIVGCLVLARSARRTA